jgi:hypothetical protein
MEILLAENWIEAHGPLDIRNCRQRFAGEDVDDAT